MRLQGMRTYLAGAMDRVADGGEGWRNRITPILKALGVTVLNPCDKPVEVGLEDAKTRSEIEYLKNVKNYSKIREIYGVIRTLDLRCVDISDFIIASVDVDVHACGTYEEITVANSQKKPVLVWCHQGKKNAPNWLFFMLPHEHIFGSLDALLEYLINVHTGRDSKHYKRWFFFDQNRMR